MYPSFFYQFSDMLLYFVLSDSIFISMFLSKVLFMRVTILLLIASISFTCFSDEYVWKSKAEPIDYKCVPDKEVGINWDKDGDEHKVVTFNSATHDDFFLTHISNIPDKAFDPPKLPINERKARFERQLFDGSNSHDDFIFEDRSYFLRKASADPDDSLTYYLSKCSYTKMDSGSKTISCDSPRNFELDLVTMRFVTSYLGTWHSSNKPSDYSGDSAVISYGMCRKYYR